MASASLVVCALRSLGPFFNSLNSNISDFFFLYFFYNLLDWYFLYHWHIKFLLFLICSLKSLDKRFKWVRAFLPDLIVVLFNILISLLSFFHDATNYVRSFLKFNAAYILWQFSLSSFWISIWLKLQIFDFSYIFF